MGFFDFLRTRQGARAPRATAAALVRPQLEGLESRVVPYAVSGNAWPSPQLITISFVPDGTPVSTSGTSVVNSNLFAAFNGNPRLINQWQTQILKAAQAWAAQININFAVVGDDGEVDVGLLRPRLGRLEDLVLPDRRRAELGVEGGEQVTVDVTIAVGANDGAVGHEADGDQLRAGPGVP